MAEWLLKAESEPRWLYALDPGFGTTVEQMLQALRCDAKRLAAKRISEMQLCFCCMAKVLELQVTGRAAESFTPLLLSVDCNGQPADFDPKHRVIYICLFDVFETAVYTATDTTGFNIDGKGTAHLVVGEPPDVRRLRVQPQLPASMNGKYVVVFPGRCP